MIDPVIKLTLCAGLALLFATAAWHKLSDRGRFGATLRAYELLPPGLVSPLASLLPILELSIAVGLLSPPIRPLATLAAMAVLGTYTLAIGTNLARGRREIDCGCFASSSRVPLTGRLIVRNLLLLCAAALLMVPVRPRALIWVDLLTLMAAVITLCTLWTAAQRLAQTGSAWPPLGGQR